MGKIKSRMKYRLCPCGSKKLASECCLKNGKWNKPATKLKLRDTLSGKVVNNCYLNELNSCQGPLSGEHLISESVLRVLTVNKKIRISGASWIKSEKTEVSVKNLVSNCLCKKHNESLSPLDEVAAIFFSSLKQYLTTDNGEPRQILISGHDLERWMLKTTKNLAVSGSFATGGEKLAGTFSTDLSIVEMLENPTCWNKGMGLYCIMKSGDVVSCDSEKLSIQPHLNEYQEIAAVEFRIMMLSFLLFLVQPNPSNFPSLNSATFRPRDIIIKHPKSVSYLTMSWDDNVNHNPIILTKE